MNNSDYFSKYFNRLNERLHSVNQEDLRQIANLAQNVHLENRKIIVVGNGGSAAMASHVTVDFTKGAHVLAKVKGSTRKN